MDKKYNFNMRLFKRGKIWHVCFKRGVCRSLKTKDEREARTRLRELQREAIRGKLLIMERQSNLTLKQFAEQYKEWASNNLAHSTYQTILQTFSKFITAVGNKGIATLKSRDMDIFINYCRQLKNNPVTINIAIRIIKATFSKAVEWEYLKANPFQGFKQLKTHNKPPQFIQNERDIKKIFDVIGNNKRYRLIFALLIYTGARRGEICKLQWQDIKQDVIIFRQRKNYKQLQVPILPQLKQILDEYRQVVGQVVDIIPSQVSHGIKHYLRLAGLGHLRTHDLRHTFASQLLLSGVDLKVIQELLGHSNYRTTEMYAHLIQDHLKKAISKLPY